MKRIILLLLVAIPFISCKNYGTKVKKGNIEVFYKEGITADEAGNTADMIRQLDASGGSNDTTVRRSFQLLRSGDTVTLRMVVNENKYQSIGDESFRAIANMVSEKVFTGKPVNMELTNTTFKTLKHLAYKKADQTEDVNAATFGEKVTEGKTEVYAKGANADESTLLAGYLNDYFKPEVIYSFQLVKDEKGNYTVKMVGNPDKINTLDNKFFEDVCKGICDKVLSVPSVSFEMTDTKFNPLRTFNYPADAGDPDRNN